MAKFDLKGLLSERSVQEEQPKQKIVYKDPAELIPSEDNFYSVENLEKLKQSIKLLGLLQPLLIEERDGKDYIIAGHSRQKCCLELVQEGEERFRKVPCVYTVKTNLNETAGDQDNILKKIMIIQANTYREKSDWEKMTETLQMEQLVKKLREKVELEGKTRQITADLIGTSTGQIGRYRSISTNLSTELMAEFKESRINVSVATELAGLTPEFQKQAYNIFLRDGLISINEVKLLKARQEQEKEIPGQMTIEEALHPHREEDDTAIPVETQIGRFYESLRKNIESYVRRSDLNMTIYMLSALYGTVRIRNGYLNYQGIKTGILFNPETDQEELIHWEDFSRKLIEKYGKKKTVKTTTIDEDERKSDLTAKEAVKAFRDNLPKTFGAMMRAIRHAKNNQESAVNAQKVLAPCGYTGHCDAKMNVSFWSLSKGLNVELNQAGSRPRMIKMSYRTLVTEARAMYDPFAPEFDEEGKESTKIAACHTGKSKSGYCGAAAYCGEKYQCCSACPNNCNSRCGWLEDSCHQAAEPQDEKQHDPSEDDIKSDHTGDLAEMLPESWPEYLKDIPVPTETALASYLYDQERDLKQILDIEKEEPGLPHMTIMQQQMVVAGLRLLQNYVKSMEEPEQPPLPEMKNNDQRKEWLRNHKSWGLWYTDPHTGARYYKYDFDNGARLIAEEYDPEPKNDNSWWVPTESCYLHLVGGPEPERAGGVPKWTHHPKYNKFPNSETELIEFLKEIQK